MTPENDFYPLQSKITFLSFVIIKFGNSVGMCLDYLHFYVFLLHLPLQGHTLGSDKEDTTTLNYQLRFFQA